MNSETGIRLVMSAGGLSEFGLFFQSHDDSDDNAQPIQRQEPKGLSFRGTLRLIVSMSEVGKAVLRLVQSPAAPCHDGVDHKRQRYATSDHRTLGKAYLPEG